MVIKGYYGDKEGNEDFTVNSCGHIFTFHGREICRPQGRNDYLLLYIYRGDTKFFFAGRSEKCSSGTFILYEPHEPQHHIYESNATGEFYYVHFSVKNKEALDLLGMKSASPSRAEPSTAICDIFEEILTELQQKDTHYKEMTEYLTKKLFIKIRRHLDGSSVLRADAEIAYVIQHINRNYNENKTLDEYAEMCGASKFHFIRSFKSITGQTPLKYRNILRIEHAKDMLISTNANVNRISEELGYSSTEYFSEAFKKAVGVSPQLYRNQNTTSKTGR